MNPETIEKIKEVFAPIADKIGQGSQYGWEVVMKQQYVVGIGNVILAVFMLGVAIFSGWWIYLGFKNKDNWDSPEIAWFFGSLGIIIGGLVFSISFYDALAHFINPAYYALDFFIHLGK